MRGPEDLPVGDDDQNVVGLVLADNVDGLVDDGGEVRGPAELDVCGTRANQYSFPYKHILGDLKATRYIASCPPGTIS